MQFHGWEAVLFYVLAVMTMITAVFVVTARVAVHSALFLISTLVNVALMFILMRSEFVAGVQILVYVGGVMVLFLFVIMLVQTRAEEQSRIKIYNGQMVVAVVVAITLGISFFSALKAAQGVLGAPDSGAQAVERVEPNTAGAGASISKDTQMVGEALYKQAALPFEIASLLLLVAIIGAVVLARTSRQEKSFDQAGSGDRA